MTNTSKHLTTGEAIARTLGVLCDVMDMITFDPQKTYPLPRSLATTATYDAADGQLLLSGKRESLVQPRIVFQHVRALLVGLLLGVGLCLLPSPLGQCSSPR